MKPVHSLRSDTTCPSCQMRIPHMQSTAWNNQKPRKGDLSVCINCATVLVLSGRGELHAATAPFLRSLPLATQIELESAVAHVRRLNHNLQPPTN